MDSLQQRSRLLGLPTEILKRIVELVVGGQVLHVNLKRDAYHVCHCWKYEECPRLRGPGFYITPCVAQVSEQQAWEEFQPILPHSVPRGDKAEYYVPKPCIRHRECESYQELDCNDLPAISPFSIFYVCSQLTREAFHIFWATNTFSISSWPTFVELLKSISERSKRTIRTIDLDVKFHHEINDNIDTIDGLYDDEIDIIDPVDLKALSNLDSLHLSVCSMMLTRLGFKSAAMSKDLNLRKTFARDVLRLQMPNFKRLNIIVYDDVEDYVCIDLWPYNRPTRKRKQELAKLVHEILTDDNRQVLSELDLRIHETEKLLQDLKDTQTWKYHAQHRKIYEKKKTITSTGADAFNNR
ncbi:MAG: hypothetical protein L6R38_008866 [Xanthoria sp. 2 TBL-2021]|nr:MAG: hypothetical protein L6R38_008866 [Xanthoria sp. 2 TBL-2021]